MSVTLLEYVLALTGVVTLALSLWAIRDSWHERRVLVSTQVNGLKWATVNAHISRDAARVLASVILAAAGVWLLCLPNDVEAPALVAKHALMFLGWCMSVSVYADRAMRRKIRVHLDAYSGDAKR